MAAGPAEIQGFYELPLEDRNVWTARYGASAPYFWGAQSGNLTAPPGAQGFYALPEDQQATWYGEYGATAPAEWARQSGAGAAASGAPGLTANAPAAPPGQGAPARPTGWSPMTPSGLTGFLDYGRKAINLLPEYVPFLNDPKLAPGYLPSSGAYNQFPLNQQGLFGTVPGTTGTVNLRYGLGGPGDPTNGSEIQTPERWVTGNPAASLEALQGDAKWRATGGTWKGGGGMGGGGTGLGAWERLSPGVEIYHPQGRAGAGGGGAGGGFFGSTVQSNWGQTPETAGLDFLGTLFLRSDTPTGISTAAWSAPQQMWDALINEIRRGRITIQDPQAWAMLAQKNPAYTPQNIGGAALTGAQPGAGAPAAGATDERGYYATMAAVAQANQAMQQAYTEWTMATGDEKLAMEKAQQVWQNTFNQRQQEFNEGVTQAGLTGQYQGAPTVTEQQRQWQNAYNAGQLLGSYEGQDTLAKQQLEQQGALSLLQLQSQLQGPRSWAKYWQLNQATPQGLQDALGALAGRYNLAGSAGQGTPGAATLESRVADLTSNAQDQAAGTPVSGSLTAPNQFALRNWSAMSPSQQQGVVGLYEGAGYDPDDFLKQLANAAPRYSGPAGGTVRL